MAIPFWVVVCMMLAGVKILAGLLGFAVTVGVPDLPLLNGWHLTLLLAFGVTTLVLIFAGRRDTRSVYLGIVFLLIASAFAHPGIERLAYLPQGILARCGSILFHVHPDAFVSFFFWVFVRKFPRATTSFRAEHVVRRTTQTALIIGAVLFALNCLMLFASLLSFPLAFARTLSLFSRTATIPIYWTLLFAVALPAVPFALWKTRFAPVDEQRRVRVFISAILIGIVPLMIAVMLEALIPSYRDLVLQPEARHISGLILYPLLLLVPLLTAYSVLVHRVLDVQLIIRRAVQYALARSVLVAVVSAPAFLLIYYIYTHRDQTIAVFFSAPNLLWFGAAIALGLAGLRWRHALFDSLDRRFFREQYDARQILALLADKCKEARDLEKLRIVLTTEVNKALHLESFVVLVADFAVSKMIALSGRLRALSCSSSLAMRMEKTAEPLEISFDDEASAFRRLPLDEQQWLVDGGVRLLVPLLASDGTLLGLLAAGEKKSELPFSKEDRLLLKAIASSAALTVELRQSKELVAEMSPVEAVECKRCGNLYPAGTAACKSCGRELVEAIVPYTLMGKFRFEKQIGAGGMGVVYRAVDLVLDRVVAIKTLPMASPERSFRLRREARVIASVKHPNLALIFGAETWRGLPMLVFELLEGGTLADRLRKARLPIQETLNLGVILAEVLEYLHSRSMLHRDIKPGNIGYQLPGDVPKLMDFGLAHLLTEARPEISHEQSSDAAGLPDGSTATTLAYVPSHFGSGRLLGTPAYLSPEAIEGKPADSSFDLWSAAIVLYESLAGNNPLKRNTIPETLECIVSVPVPDVRDFVPECPDDVAQFFKDALSRDPRRRPGSARQLKLRLCDLQTGGIHRETRVTPAG